MKLLLGSGLCAVLVGAGLSASAAPAWACPSGTVPTDFAGVCVSGQAGAGAPVNGQLTAPAMSPGHGAVMGSGPNSLPSVDGIPCTPQKIGTCIGLTESQG